MPNHYLIVGGFAKGHSVVWFAGVNSLREIGEAIARLPTDERRQLVQDMPAICPGAFSADGWDTILQDHAPCPALASLLDRLDAEYQQT